MASPTSSKPTDRIANLDDPDTLGLKKSDLAAGKMFKSGLIWGLVATVASYGILAIGRKPGNAIDKVAKYLTDTHHDMREGFGKGVAWVAKNIFRNKATLDPEHVAGPAITATSLIVGGIVGHVMQVPAAADGIREADLLNKKYKNALAATKNHEHENQILAADIDRLNVALAKAQRPDPMAEKDAASSSRGV